MDSDLFYSCAVVMDTSYVVKFIYSGEAATVPLLHNWSFVDLCNSIRSRFPDLIQGNFMLRAEAPKSYMTKGWESYIHSEGQKFEGGVVEFRDKLRKYAIEIGFSYEFVRNDKVRVIAQCSKKHSQGCNWLVKAHLCRANGFFMIKRLVNVHTCHGVIRLQKSKMMGSKVVKSIVLDKIRANPNKKPIDIADEIKSDYGLDVAYRTVWYGTELAKTALHGDEAESYAQLLWFSESVMKSNSDSRIVSLPILDINDGIRVKSMASIAARKQDAEEWFSELCPVIEKKLKENLEVGRHWRVSRSDTYVYEVHCQKYNSMVNLETRFCSCGEWQLYGFPCSHALVVIQQHGSSPYLYVNELYKVEKYRETYSFPINPLPSISKQVHDFGRDAVILQPPLTRRPPGRPRKKRFRKRSEKTRVIKCGRCGKCDGHNRKSCTAPI
ncbi:uncharacterized protein LOC133745675 [Rosa rugosa]|uniref:uncharacterized protein LOC133745675 n=1 Tax=Rosa rugosa TaxID=74645 RepID=UPI002B40B758|nr:uncharacterized protein LOC133745675 [Rosa rugosa]